jgi:hypothetical protein
MKFQIYIYICIVFLAVLITTRISRKLKCPNVMCVYQSAYIQGVPKIMMVFHIYISYFLPYKSQHVSVASLNVQMLCASINVPICTLLATRHTSMLQSNYCHTRCCISGVMVSIAQLILFPRSWSDWDNRVGGRCIDHALHVPQQLKTTGRFVLPVRRLTSLQQRLWCFMFVCRQ